MSKTSKTKSKERRKREKAARKATQRALYASYVSQGRNSKRSRVKAKSAAGKVNGISHPEGRCGNVGCKRCQGIHYNAFLVKGVPSHMPSWMWQHWSKLSKEERVGIAR